MVTTLDVALTKQLIDAKQILEAFIAAARAVISSKASINEINYFPVADKDTGENLSFSFHEISQIQLKSSSLQDVIKQVSQSIFENARGNSGLIFSMWFTGLEAFRLNQTKCTLTDIKQLLLHGAEHLDKTMENIMPGTMVTFIKCFTQKLQNISSLKEIHKTLALCLKDTIKENKASRAHGVVDAGALATEKFLKHFFDTLYKTESVSHVNLPGEIVTAEIETHDHPILEKPVYRYCTQAFVDLPKHALVEKISEIKLALTELGDCDLLTQREQSLHFHIHTNEPATLFNRLYQHGKVRKPKIEDMLRQYQAIHTKRKVALVTDSSADIDQALIEQYQIHLLPLSLTFDEQEGLDPYTINKADFYKQIACDKQYPKTASPNLKKVKALLTFLSQHYNKIIVVTISSKMSATYQSILTVAGSIPKVTVFDSLTNSGAHGLIVLRAAEMLEKNLSAHQVLEKLAKHRKNVSIFVAVNSIKSMLASGRVKGLKSVLLRFLKPKLMITVNANGVGTIAGMLFLRKSAHSRLLKLMIHQHKKRNLQRYCVLYVTDKQAAEAFAHKLAEAIGLRPMYITAVSSAIGLHAGESALAVAFE